MAINIRPGVKLGHPVPDISAYDSCAFEIRVAALEAACLTMLRFWQEDEAGFMHTEPVCLSIQAVLQPGGVISIDASVSVGERPMMGMGF